MSINQLKRLALKNGGARRLRLANPREAKRVEDATFHLKIHFKDGLLGGFDVFGIFLFGQFRVDVVELAKELLHIVGYQDEHRYED